MTPAPPRLRLFEYYALEGINAVAAPLFFCCFIFWTRQFHGYSDVENLLLMSVCGVAYIVCALYSGALADRLGSDRLIAIAQAVASLCLLTGWMPSWRGTPFLVVIVHTACMASTWTALEAASQRVASRLNTPRRTGVYNIVWSCSCILAYVLGGALYRWWPVSAFLMPAFLHLVNAAWLMRPVRRRAPVALHPADDPHRGDSVPKATKRRFVRTAWTANSLAYFILNALGGLTPAIGVRLGLDPSVTIWLFSTMQVARAGGFILFWFWERWHYHMGWTIVAVVVAPVCLVGIFFAPTVGLVALALAGLGLACALSYAGSLYYSLDFGSEKGAHSGRHEALIGLGLFLGPIAGATGGYMFSNTAAAQATIVVMSVVLTVGGIVWARR